MEAYLEDVEKRYENDKVSFNQTQLEIQILKDVKDELAVKLKRNLSTNQI